MNQERFYFINQETNQVEGWIDNPCNEGYLGVFDDDGNRLNREQLLESDKGKLISKDNYHEDAILVYKDDGFQYEFVPSFIE